MKKCNKYDNILHEIYQNAGLSCTIERSECVKLNCFLEVLPDHYPPRIPFERKEHTPKNGAIRVSSTDHRTIFSFNTQIVRIDDLFIAPDEQGKKYGKKIVSGIKAQCGVHMPNFRAVTLLALPKSVIRWHKIGFAFYDKKHENLVRDIVEEFLYDLNENEDKVENIARNMRLVEKAHIERGLERKIASEISDGIPMVMEVGNDI